MKGNGEMNGKLVERKAVSSQRIVVRVSDLVAKRFFAEKAKEFICPECGGLREIGRSYKLATRKGSTKMTCFDCGFVETKPYI